VLPIPGEADPVDVPRVAGAGREADAGGRRPEPNGVVRAGGGEAPGGAGRYGPESGTGVGGASDLRGGGEGLSGPSLYGQGVRGRPGGQPARGDPGRLVWGSR